MSLIFLLSCETSEIINCSSIDNTCSYSLSLERGRLDYHTGLITGFYSADDVYNYVRTAEYYETSDQIPQFNIDTTLYSYKLYLYDKDYRFKKASNILSDYFNASYFKLVLTSRSNSSIVTIPTVYSNVNTSRKNNLTPLVFHKLTIPVYIENQRSELYDQALLILPPNYSVDGPAVRLAIYCHGSGAMCWDRMPSGHYYDFIIPYIAKEGYAVLIVNGITNKGYQDYYPIKDKWSGDNCLDNLGTPLALASYRNAYDFIIRNFNVEKEIVIFGKSLGGAYVANIVNQKIVPVIAAAALAPTWDIVSEILRNRSQEYLKYYSEQFNLPDTIDFSTAAQIEIAGYFKDHASKFIEYNPLWKNTENIDVDLALTFAYSHPVVATGIEYPEERLYYEGLSKTFNCPYKVWIAPDDYNVDPRFCEYVQAMAENANAEYHLRWMPINTGGHWAVDRTENCENPLIVTVLPQYSSQEMVVPLAIYEVVQWWRENEGQL